MTEAEQFEVVLHELGILLAQLGDVGRDAVLIGGQVLALEALERHGSGALEVRTETDLVIQRGFTMEPDVFFDFDEETFQAPRLVEVLRARGYSRPHRQHRWERELTVGTERVTVAIDLFAPPGLPEGTLPTHMTPLEDARLVMRHLRPIEVQLNGQPLRLTLPDSVAFLAMKLRARKQRRAAKDGFDIYAYVKLLGADAVLKALAHAGEEGLRIQHELGVLYFDRGAPGVKDVLQFAPGLLDEEEQLLRQEVVDLFAEFY